MTDTPNPQEEEKTEIDKYLFTAKSFHLEMPLYHVIDITDEDIKKIIYIYLKYGKTIDAFCIECNKDSVFSMSETSDHRTFDVWDSWAKFERVAMSCSRDVTHIYTIFYLRRKDRFQKIGQFPSVADFQIPQAESYRKILGEDQYQEFTKAIGLMAHGVGIGSFVYLRRIFEKLIEEAHLKAKTEENWNEEKYLSSRMDDRIKLLKHFLPEFLVENKNIYSILSKGIHELGEDECLKYFVSVKIGIEQILDEKIEKADKLRKAEIARQAIEVVSQELSK
ncbi:MAG TPA: short-chain dehydrogenase [Patescibacteria group bacterium]|nr:short-chain dehydrogenase [Patescibacteria group bacterium]